MSPLFLTKETLLSDYLTQLSERGIRRIALDLEGDQGTVHYHNRISIFQIFDGQQSAIIDVLSMDHFDVLKAFLSGQEFQKVMFACSNDEFMCQNVLDVSIENVRDISIAQKLLSVPVNLSNIIGIEKDEKDKLQRANWLKRPLSDKMVSYAINDVLELLHLEEEYEQELKTKNLLGAYINACEEIPKHDYRIEPLFMYARRIGSYKHLKPDKKLILRTIWIYRELIGEFLDRPVGYLFSRKLIPFWVRRDIDPRPEIQKLVEKHTRHRKQMTEEELNLLWKKAGELAEKAPY